MKRAQTYSPRASTFHTEVQPPCPECQGATFRVWRRPVDRVSAFLMPTRRYRCQSFQCQWEGNIRQRALAAPTGSSTPAHAGDAPGLPRIFLLSMAFALAAAAFIVVATTTDWLEPGGLLVSTPGMATPSLIST